MTATLETLTGLMRTMPWLAPVLALLAGVLASFSPCCLSSIPLVIGYVEGAGQRGTRRAFLLSLTFAAGSAVIFTALGIVAATAGRLMGAYASWWYLVLGLLMILMALQTWEVVSIIPSSYLMSKNNKTGFLGAFLAGILGGIFSTPCSTPILIALLAVVAGRGSPAWGVLLLFLYAVGHGALAVIAGTSVGFVRGLSASAGYGRWSAILKYFTGAVILIIGLYLLWLGF